MVELALAEQDVGAQGGDSLAANQLEGTKRQYLIAPRIGRSAGGNQAAAIWSSLEEAAQNQIGQIQPNRGFPGPLRSSLLFLVGNRRVIGPRSSGLLPQARIGRRAAPVGLMPQPRVGRRSDSSMDELRASNEQEVAVATLSDSTLNDAIESLLSD